MRRVTTTGASGERVFSMLPSACRKASRTLRRSVRLASMNMLGVPRMSAPPACRPTMPPPESGARWHTLSPKTEQFRYFAMSFSYLSPLTLPLLGIIFPVIFAALLAFVTEVTAVLIDLAFFRASAYHAGTLPRFRAYAMLVLCSWEIVEFETHDCSLDRVDATAKFASQSRVRMLRVVCFEPVGFLWRKRKTISHVCHFNTTQLFNNERC